MTTCEICGREVDDPLKIVCSKCEYEQAKEEHESNATKYIPEQSIRFDPEEYMQLDSIERDRLYPGRYFPVKKEHRPIQKNSLERRLYILEEQYIELLSTVEVLTDALEKAALCIAKLKDRGCRCE